MHLTISLKWDYIHREDTGAVMNVEGMWWESIEMLKHAYMFLRYFVKAVVMTVEQPTMHKNTCIGWHVWKCILTTLTLLFLHYAFHSMQHFWIHGIFKNYFTGQNVEYIIILSQRQMLGCQQESVKKPRFEPRSEPRSPKVTAQHIGI